MARRDRIEHVLIIFSPSQAREEGYTSLHLAQGETLKCTRRHEDCRGDEWKKASNARPDETVRRVPTICIVDTYRNKPTTIYRPLI